ncbi:acyltransferase family protein [Bradyrhizobium yuanmingense]|uniref:acyltransferase family protein n=1 Tax=Bradyrhizobium yuanmingense TaxID=108015 RepID=UPI0023B965A5|nr:acyltransferase [Bradyrhizobium yuanmingense]MDF0578888.1 acyltransferase [Bradyrhizobium yuanmingense]
MNESKKNQYIQGARGLFCLMVFVYHVHHSEIGTFDILKTPIANFLLGTLQFGVELFYGISGIVIIGSLLRAPTVSMFVWDRITRIYPVLWATILVTATVGWITGAWTVSFIKLFSSLFPPLELATRTGHVNPIAWTLDYELTFYIISAFIMAVGHRSLAAVAAFAVGAVIIVCYPRTTMMLTGVVIFVWLLKSSTSADRFARHSLFFFVIYLLSWQAIVEIFGGGNVDAFGALLAPTFWAGITQEILIILATVLGGVALLGIVKGYGQLGRILSMPALVYMGTISYSFYLWHIPIMGGVKRIQLYMGYGHLPSSQLILFVSTLPISLVTAIVSYELIEKRLSQYLRQLKKHQRKNPTGKHLEPTKDLRSPA